MPRRIGVLGICESGEMALSLRELLPSDSVQSISWPGGSPEDKAAWFMSAHREHDVLVINHVGLSNIPDLPAVKQTGVQCIVYPHIHFHAFHPDMTYAGHVVDGRHQLISGYHSSICLASFLAGIPPAEAIALFNGRTFEALGYFDEWEASVSILESRFSEYGINFRKFLLKVKRASPFMLSTDHPKIAAVNALAARVAIDLMGGPDSLEEWPLYIGDHLSALFWPVYPEIGEYYGCRTVYEWDVDGHMLDLSGYVQLMYQKYAQMELKPSGIFFGRTGFRQRFDAVLNTHAGA